MQVTSCLHQPSSIRQQWPSVVTTANLPAASRRLRVRSSASGNSSSSFDSSSNDEDRIWSQLAFPSYLQSKNKHKPEVCRDFEKAVTAAEHKQARHALAASVESCDEEEDEEWEPETVWHTIRREAERDAAAEPLLSSFLYASILAHDTFERALAFVLSNRLANAVMLPTQLFEIFHEVLISEPDVREAALADVEACRERDPACTSYSQALLYYKGYHAIQTHRIAHALWMRGQKVMAVALQSRMSEVLAVDIHPAARFGRGILLDHGTGVVIGETAIIGNNVSLLQNVTLGGTGKDHGDRHPKISDNVLIGACATVLGNIRVGEGAQIAAGSLVLKPVVAHTMVAGSPAKPVGHVTGNPAEKMQQWSKKLLNWDPFAEQPPAAAKQQEQQQPQPPEEPSLRQQQQQQQRQQPPSSGAEAAAVGSNGTAASKPSGRRPPKPSRHIGALIAANEARWDAVAAQVSAAGGDCAPLNANSSSNGTASSSVANGTPLANGVTKGWIDANVLQGSSGTSKVSMNGSSVAASSNRKDAAAAASSPQVQQPPLLPSQPQQQQQDQCSGHAAQPPAAAVGGQAAAAVAAAPSGSVGGAEQHPVSAAAAGRKQASAALRGLHEGTVEATLDEEVAAEKWSSRKEEPEYVI